MTATSDRDRWRALDPWLDRVLELTTGERTQFLEALRATSPTLAEELQSVLADEADASRAGFLARPLADPLAGPRPGLVLGGYAIERPLGSGGMGSVWLAERADGRFEGRVAIKFLHHALLDDVGRERFRREGSMLARLAHPGIARLFDAGVTDGGQPYLVLEYVEGDRIDAAADERRLGVADRLRLVLQVLAAVDHAHARLIIHRDLKPSNILLAADGTAKLLDFGIATLAAEDGAEERTALTVDGARALTPEFAAPEQVRGEPVTTATDVHAVGVLLYVLLTGKRPFDLAGRSAAEMERIVCDVDPPRPSATFAGPPNGDEREARARARGGTPERLRRQLRGDLDAIVMRALHKAPERRYPSAAALAEDVERFLDGRPVRARPDGPGYRVRKFVARHRGGVTVAAGAAALLLGGAVREWALRGRAEAEARKARAVEEYLVSVFGVADPYAVASASGRPDSAQAAAVRALLDRGAARLDSALAGQAEVQAELRGVLGRVYGNLGMYDAAAGLLRRALAQQRALHGPRHRAVAEVMDRLGQVSTELDRYDEAEPLLREALAQRRALFGSADTATAASLDHLATLLQQRGALAESESLFREAVAVRRAVHGPDSPEVAEALNNLALLLMVRGADAEAEPLLRQSIAIDAKRLGEIHPSTAETVHNLAQLEYYRGRFAQAETLYRRALIAKRKLLGDTHPSVTVNLNNLGMMLAVEMGRVDEGEVMVREALALDRRIFGEHHSYVSEGLRNLGTVMRLRGNFAEAERLYRRTLDMNRTLFGPVHPRVGTSLYLVAQTRQLAGDLAGAIPLYRESVAIFARTVGERHPNYVLASTNLARALEEHGEAPEAERLFRAAAAHLDTTDRAQRASFIIAQIGLGQALVDEGRAAEAVPGLERALAMSRERFGDGHWRTAEARLALGRCLAATGQRARATALLRQADAALWPQRRAQPRLAARARAEWAKVAPG